VGQDIDELIELGLVHEIHTSERRSFRACRRRWDWLFRQSYYPKTTAKPLEFGIAFHKAMETYYNPTTWDWDREVVAAQSILDFVAVCEEQKAAALDVRDQLYLDNDPEEDYQERVELGKGMLKYYFGEVAPVEDRGWKPVRVEIGFMVSIPHPRTGEALWCKCHTCGEKWTKQFGDLKDFEGLPVVYAGRLDMLAQDAKGNYYIFDWKTAARISDDTVFLLLDDQIASYVWALRKLGIDVKGFVYHEQRKAYPQPPVKNKVRRMGRIFSINKQQAVDYDSYLKAVIEEDSAAHTEGLYDEMLDYLKNDKAPFHARHQVIKSYDEIEETERNIGLEALEIIDPNLGIYPSPGRFGCNFCAFRQPCLETNGRGDVQYVLDELFEKREHYYVRQEASTESKGGE
jgi:hypothetical protein